MLPDSASSSDVSLDSASSMSVISRHVFRLELRVRRLEHTDFLAIQAGLASTQEIHRLQIASLQMQVQAAQFCASQANERLDRLCHRLILGSSALVMSLAVLLALCSERLSR